MSEQQDYERNNTSYRQLRETIARSYPAGWFVGIADEQVVGAAATFRELEQQLRERGKDPRKVLVVEAGVVYPESLTVWPGRTSP